MKSSNSAFFCFLPNTSKVTLQVSFYKKQVLKQFFNFYSHFNFHSFLGTLFIFICISLPSNAQSPNILLIIADDVGVGEIPNYLPDATKANMPHLKSLMDTGLTFDNVWSNPLCAPSRANILTGKHGFRTNVLNAESLATLDIEETSLHEYIDQTSNGSYSSSLIGKWHLGGGSNNNPIYDYPNELGIEYFAGILGGGVGNYENYTWVENEQGASSTEYITTKITNTAINWIGEQNQPWFCWLAYNAPHTPIHLPPTNLHTQGDLPTDDASIEANPQPYFLAMVESVDTEMGRLLESIPASELENTIVIFVGDNGTSGGVIQAPYPSARAKGSLYQGGVHVPMVVSGAGVTRQNEREEALVSFSDLFATIVELTGTSLSQIHDSYSFADLLSSQGEGQRDCNYTEISSNANASGWAARDATFKYISFDNGNQRFYNLIDDPYESNNLFPNLNNLQQASFDKLSKVREVFTSIEEPATNTQSLSIFPNPVQKTLYLNWQNPKQESFVIFDLSGKVLQSGDLIFGKNTLSIEGLQTGMYFIEVGGVRKKFVKY
ncbi:MAG: sulfatase-like hydrolase/transferase [Chitinophagales bacterium]